MSKIRKIQILKKIRLKDIASKIKNLEERRANTKLVVVKKGKNLKNQKVKNLLEKDLSLLFDNGDFTEIDPYVKHFSNDFGLDKSRIDGDSVVVGYGTVNGQQVFAFFKTLLFLEDHYLKLLLIKYVKFLILLLKQDVL